MSREVILDDADAPGSGESLIDQPVQPLGVFGVRPSLSDLGMRPAHVGSNQQEGAGGADPVICVG
jgi:hypothetical protein